MPPYSTLLPLPYPYVVPGGRFREVYYWDSYFTMLGLEADGQHELAVDMLKDFAYEIDKYGHIPNGNRSYYLSRSQPPFFSLMVDLIAQHDGAATYVTYLPELQAEYDYWMQGEDDVLPGRAAAQRGAAAGRKLCSTATGTSAAPRGTSSYKEDVQTASQSPRPAAEVWRNLRAAAEIGLGFQLTLARRRQDPGHDPDTRRCCRPISTACSCISRRRFREAYLRKGDDATCGGLRESGRKNRIDAIRRVMWDAEDGVFTDYLWRQGRTTRKGHRRNAVSALSGRVHCRTGASGRRHRQQRAAGARRPGDDIGEQRPAMGCAERLGAAAMDRGDRLA